MMEMMKKTTIFLVKSLFTFSLIHLFAFSLIACGGGDDDDADGGGKKPDYIVASEVMDLSDTKENVLSIKANCKWVLYVDVDWLFLDPASGENNGKVTITASPNKTGADRSATIYMRNEANTLENTVIINQRKAPDNSFVPEPGENPLPE
jgi:hypothetical protein